MIKLTVLYATSALFGVTYNREFLHTSQSRIEELEILGVIRVQPVFDSPSLGLPGLSHATASAGLRKMKC